MLISSHIKQGVANQQGQDEELSVFLSALFMVFYSLTVW